MRTCVLSETLFDKMHVTHTGIRCITDTGLKHFSAALGSSSTITTVQLGCTSCQCLARVSIPFFDWCVFVFY